MRRLRAAAVAAAALLLAGCATIPTSGPVQTPGPVRAPRDPSIVFIPAGPVDGASPADVVRGFVQAAGAGEPFTVAKQFLTAERAAAWRPAARVLVQGDSESAQKATGSRVALRVSTVGQVNGQGVYTPSSSPKAVPLDFGLVRERGQWRINDMEDGVVLAQRAVPRVLGAPLALQFFSSDYQRFVPDLRWFLVPARQERVARATDAVTALLAGRSSLLAGSVATTAFPSSARLSAPVEIAGGRTTVRITTGEAPDSRTTERMQQQLARTLGIAPAALRLEVNGGTAPPVTDGGPEPQTTYQAPLVETGGRFGTLSASGLRPDAVFGARIVQQRPRAVTVSQRQGLAAVLTGRGQVALLGRSGAAKVVDRRDVLVPPTVDQRGWTYSVPTGSPGALQVTPSSGRSRILPGGLLGSSVVAIEVSPDGTRLLALLQQTGTGPIAYVAGIERDSSGAPVGLTAATVPVVFSADSAFDATWVDASTVAILTGSGDTQTVVRQQVGGASSTLGLLPDAARSISAAASSQGGVRVLTDSGDLLVRPTSTWQSEISSSGAVGLLGVQR